MCKHEVTVQAGPALRLCTKCGSVLERLPEPTGCEGGSCQQNESN